MKDEEGMKDENKKKEPPVNVIFYIIFVLYGLLFTFDVVFMLLQNWGAPAYKMTLDHLCIQDPNESKKVFLKRISVFNIPHILSNVSNFTQTVINFSCLIYLQHGKKK